MVFAINESCARSCSLMRTVARTVQYFHYLPRGSVVLYVYLILDDTLDACTAGVYQHKHDVHY